MQHRSTRGAFAWRRLALASFCSLSFASWATAAPSTTPSTPPAALAQAPERGGEHGSGKKHGRHPGRGKAGRHAHKAKHAPAPEPASESPAAEAGPAKPAEARKEAKAEQIEEIEEIEDIADVAVAASPAGGGDANASANGAKASEGAQNPYLRLLGRFHAAAVHLPLAWLILLVLLEGAVLFGHSYLWLPLCAPLALLTSASTLPAIITGLLRLNELPSEGNEAALLHRNLMFVACGILLGLTGLLYKNRPVMDETLRLGYRIGLVVAALLMLHSAHVGGVLVHGEDFFSLE